MNYLMLKAKKELKKKGLFCYFKNNNILVVSEDKATMPFLYVIWDDENYPKNFMLSLAVDYPKASTVAHVVILLNAFCKVLITEDFYISKLGSTHWGEDAHALYAYDTHFSLDNIDPECENRH